MRGFLFLTLKALLLPAVLGAACGARAGFVPLPLTSASFNARLVVPASAPAPVIPGAYTTASMDAGLANTATSWYEEGYNTAAPTTGLPHPGAIFNSQSLANHSYLMAPSYTTNDAVLLDSSVPSATLALAVPIACSQISFLESGGHNGVTFSYTVHHQNGATDAGTAVIPDWYNGSNPAWIANGRVDVGTYAFSSVNGNDPCLYSLDVTVGNATSPVTSISLAYVSGSGHGAILAVSALNGSSCTPLTVTGYNADMIVEAAAATLGSLSVTTATMETGTLNTANTWYELGYDPVAPTTGLPHPASTLTNLSAPDHLYTFASSYAANDAVLVCSNLPVVSITPAAPAACHALSFLVACGNGPVTLACAIYHANGSYETASLVVPDWFSGSPIAFVANGRVNVNNTTVSSVNGGGARLYGEDISLASPASAVTNIVLTFPSNGGAANAVIFAVSGGTSVLPLAGNDFNANTRASAQILQQWYNSSGLYDSTGWWNAANCLEAIENDIFANNDLSYLSVLTNTFNLNSPGDFLDSYYDDNGWWANTWIRAYDLTGNTNFLRMAKTIFANLVGAWDSTNTSCPGGLWWNTSRTYKNAIPNELFLLAAIRLHQRTPGDGGPGSYFYWATNEWVWFKGSGLINSQNLINDGLNGCVNNGEATWTYNQGVILGGLTELYKVTGNTAYLTQAELIANAAITRLVNGNGVLVEACEPDGCGGDGPQFKGVFVRYLACLYDVTRTPAYYNFLYDNARAVWFNNRNVYNQLGLIWNGPMDSDDAARQSSAMMPVSALAEPITAQLLFAKGSGDPAFSHSLGSPAGALAWVCAPTNTYQPGSMQLGPHVTYLPTGPHAAHFQARVSALSGSTASLVQLSVVEENGGTTLAGMALPWNSFATTNAPQDFVLVFTNTVAGDPLDFDVYWNNVASAPSFTLTDVTVDGLANWTAANLAHDVGRLDGLNAWEADPVRDTASGFLSRGPGTAQIFPGDYVVSFELKVDNFNWDSAEVAAISVVDTDNNSVLASQNLTRNQFSNTLYQAFSLSFNAVPGAHYDFRTYWYFSATAPRLTQRSVILQPGPVPFFTSAQLSGTNVTLGLIGVPGRAYSMEVNDSLDPGGWSTLGGVTIPAYFGSAAFVDTATNFARYYRLHYP